MEAAKERNRQEAEKYVNETVEEVREMLKYSGLPPNLDLKTLTPLHVLAIGEADPRPMAAALGLDDYKQWINEQDSTGMTALMYAAKVMNGGIIRELLANGADTTLKNKNDKTALYIFNKAYDAAQEAVKPEIPAVKPEIAEEIRGKLAGGLRRRRKTRKTRKVRKTKRRQTLRKK